MRHFYNFQQSSIQSSFMQFLPRCALHGRTANKLCGLKQCCLVFCDICFLEHSELTGHSRALCLAPQALNFFSTFTGYTHYKMFDWIDTVRRAGFFALFAREGGEEAMREGEAAAGELAALGVRVLEEFQTLTQNNRQFVQNNKNNAQLLHPEFLRDIFNLTTERWAVSAEIIVDNLNKQTREMFQHALRVPRYTIQEQFLSSVQSYRTHLLSKNIKQIVQTANEIRTAISELVPEGFIQPKTSEPDGQKQTEEGNYELPYSIKQIQSFQEIGERGSRPHSTICSIAYDPIAIQEVQEPTEEDRMDEMIRAMEKLMHENAALQEQNRALKNQNECLIRDKIQLQAKVQALEKTNKENERSLVSIPSKGNLILRIPSRVLSLPDQPEEEARAPLTSRIGQEMFVRKVRIVK